MAGGTQGRAIGRWESSYGGGGAGVPGGDTDPGEAGGTAELEVPQWAALDQVAWELSPTTCSCS